MGQTKNNGAEPQPDRKILRLSDLYTVRMKETQLELTAVLLNINRNHNRELMEACRDLKDYAEYVDRVRKYARELPLSEAVECAITECIREGILKEFLEKNRAEVKKMSIYEYDQKKHIRMERQDAWEEGVQAGRREGIKEGIKEGMNKGLDRGIEGAVTLLREAGMEDAVILEKIMAQYHLSSEAAEKYVYALR